jgi:signal transduction histidine kinase
MITPWFSLNIYLSNIDADQFMINMTYCSILAVVVSSVIYKKLKVFYITLLSLFNLSFFYLVILKYPISLLISKIYIVAFVAIFTMIKMDYDEEQSIKLQKSQERYKILFEESPISIWEEDLGDVKTYLDKLVKTGITDIERYLDENPDELKKLIQMVKVIDVNKTTIDMYKAKDKEEIISKRGMDPFIGEKSVDTFKKAILSKWNNEKAFVSEQINYDLKGDTLDIILCSANAPSRKEWDMSIVSITDISSLKAMQKELRQSESQFHALFKESPIPLMELDLSRIKKFVQAKQQTKQTDLSKYFEETPNLIQKLLDLLIVNNVNRAAITLYKSENEKQLKTQLKDCIPSEAFNKTKEVFRSILQGKTRFELNVVHKNFLGEKIVLDNSLYVVPGYEETLSRVIIALVDVSRSRELEDRRKYFIQVTSHELRTPLTVISGFFELLKKKEMNEEQKALCYASIEKNVNRLNRLILEVSDIAKIDSGLDPSLNFERLNICKFFEDKLEEYTNLLGDQFQSSKCHEMPNVMIKGDQDRLNQVLDNVITNSIKNTNPQSREIKVDIKRISQSITITISDNGAGIDPKNLNIIFEQFVSIPTEYSVRSMGIGLFISRKIIEAHNGTINAHSDGIGKGSVFKIEFPLLQNQC